MLQNIRKNLQGTLAKVIIAIIIVPFALFGIESLLGGGGVQYVAEVNGEGISAVELQQQINQQKRRLLLNMGDDIDPAMLDDQLLAGPALEFMVQKELLIQAADAYGLALSDERLGRFIADMAVFQVDGRFDPNLYRQIISEQGYSPAGFQKALREDLLTTQLRAGIASSEFATDAELERVARIRNERRDVRYMILPLEQFRQDVELADADIEAYYAENQDRFTTPESVDLAYIELTVDDFNEPVAESRVRELFELERDSYVVPEERRVAHILFTPQENESSEAVQERIKAALDRLGSGESFDEVAQALSDDIGSAGLGGDLGFTQGDTFPAAMEAAIAELSEGEVSAPVETDAGWHLVKVTEIRSGAAPGFAEMRPALEQRLMEEEASNALVKTVEELRDLVFNADDLAGPASELGLEVQRADKVTRDESAGLFANSSLRNAAFSDDVLEQRFNSSVIEIEPEHFVVLRVVEHYPPTPRPLAEVRGQIERAIADERARENIRQQARAMLARLRDGETIENLAREFGYEWQVELAATRQNTSLPPSLLRRLFRLPPPAAESGTFEFVQNAEGDIELFELVRVSPADPSRMTDTERENLLRQLTEERGRRVDSYYQQALRDKADIVRNT